MTKRRKREREIERQKRYAQRVQKDPAGEVAKFMAEMVAKHYVTQHEVDACARRMERAKMDAERQQIQRDFLLRLKARVEADPENNEVQR